ncbi:MAG: alpha-glucosidase AglA [Acidimicrobiia bacterium]|nr:MAG: alpha-glucosidase AglA [Acidimicrobiia bacterium]
MKITIIGAGSRRFGPLTVRDILLSDILTGQDLTLMLMDIDEQGLADVHRSTVDVIDRLGRDRVTVSSTTDLDEAVSGSDFVLSALERSRYLYWSQDFHVPRQNGFAQINGENGGPGGMFHALRNFGPVLNVVRAMERECPDAWFLSFTNPEAKIGEAINRLTSIKTAGLCHGQTAAERQVGKFLGIPVEEMSFVAAGLNHFTWFQSIRLRSTGEDLYPALRERERRAHWLADWDEIALSRILFRTFGLYPSPGTNHHGEYLGWAEEFLAASRFQYFYDPAEGHPWDEGRFPPRVYNMHTVPATVPMFPTEELLLFEPDVKGLDADAPLEKTNSLVVPLIEGMVAGGPLLSDPINIPNRGAISGLPDDAIVEVPVTVDRDGVHRQELEPFPEGILALLRTQFSINELLVEAYVEESRNKLLQAVLLDPTTQSYRGAVNTIDQLCELQKDVLPPLRWA